MTHTECCQLFHRLTPLIRRRLRAFRLKDPEEREDLAQEALVGAWRALSDADWHGAKGTTVAMRGAMWAAQEYLRGGKRCIRLSQGRVALKSGECYMVDLATSRNPGLAGGFHRGRLTRDVGHAVVEHQADREEEPAEGVEPDFSEALVAKMEREGVVAEVFSRLSGRERECVLRYFWGQETHAQIGHAMGLHPNSVATYLYSALRKYRDKHGITGARGASGGRRNGRGLLAVQSPPRVL